MTMKKITIGRDVVEVDEAGYDIIKSKLDEMDEMMEKKSDMDYGDKLEMIMELLSGMDGKMDMMKEAMDMMMPKEDEKGGDEDEDMDGMYGMYGDKMDAAIDAGIKERLVLIGHLAEADPSVKMDQAVDMDATTLRRAIVAARVPSMKDSVETAEGVKLDGMLEIALSVDVSKAKVDAANGGLAKALAPKRDAAQGQHRQMSSHKQAQQRMVEGYKADRTN